MISDHTWRAPSMADSRPSSSILPPYVQRSSLTGTQDTFGHLMVVTQRLVLASPQSYAKILADVWWKVFTGHSQSTYSQAMPLKLSGYWAKGLRTVLSTSTHIAGLIHQPVHIQLWHVLRLASHHFQPGTEEAYILLLLNLLTIFYPYGLFRLPLRVIKKCQLNSMKYIYPNLFGFVSSSTSNEVLYKSSLTASDVKVAVLTGNSLRFPHQA